MLLVFGLFFVGLVLIVGFRFCSKTMFNSPMNAFFKQAEKEAKEKRRIQELPNLYGVIHTNGKVKNPVSENSASVIAIQLGCQQKLHGARTGLTENAERQGYSTTYFPDLIIDYPNNTQLYIKGKYYSIDFDKVIISKVGNQVTDKKGTLNEKIDIVNTDHGYISMHDAFNYRSFDSIRKFMKIKVQKLKGRHPIIDAYLEEKRKRPVDILLLREYQFNDGDTLIFKGRIVGDEVELLF